MQVWENRKKCQLRPGRTIITLPLPALLVRCFRLTVPAVWGKKKNQQTKLYEDLMQMLSIKNIVLTINYC